MLIAYAWSKQINGKYCQYFTKSSYKLPNRLHELQHKYNTKHKYISNGKFKTKQSEMYSKLVNCVH